MALEAIGLTPAAGELLGQATPNLKALPSFARPATPWASRWTPKPLHAARVLAALVLAPSTVRAQRVRGWKHRSASKRARTVRKSATWEKVEWASLGSSPAPAGDSASRTSSNGEVLEVPLVPLPAVYLPSPSQQLMVSEAKYLKLYDDLLAKGARHFLVTHEAPLNSQPRVARVGLLFRLKELRDVSEETNGHSKYVAEHEVGRRARILAVLNGEQHLSSTEYLRATVELLPADESQTVDVHALQRIREKLQQALAIQGEQENRPGATAELGALANRLRLASVLRAPGFWDLCSMLGSLQSFRLQLQVRTMREEVRKMTEEWAQQNPQAFKDLKRNPQVLPSKIRASGERVKELLQEGTQELQSTFQEILQTPSLSDGAVRLEEAVEQELQRMRAVRSLSFLRRSE